MRRLEIVVASARWLSTLAVGISRAVLASLLVFLLAPGMVNAEAEFSMDGAIDKIPVFVGVRDDAMPFSYEAPAVASEKVLSGFQGYMIDVCRQVLTEMSRMPEYQHLEFRSRITTARDRYEHLDNGRFLFLCGPDSITLSLMQQYRPSLPVFLSGMTYAYINPRSGKFPKGRHCDHIVGVVRGTTADKDGLRDLAERNLLMRFDKALDLELSKIAYKNKLADERMLEIVRSVKDRNERLMENPEEGPAGEPITARYSADDMTELDAILNERDIKRIHVEVDRLSNIHLSNDINGRMGEAYGQINREIASTIVTDECPDGFTSMPVKKYPNHNDGVAGLCAGEVLYYLGDYDIIRNKVREFSDCDVVLNRFTRTKEVYGVFFSENEFYYPFCALNEQTGTCASERARNESELAETSARIDIARFHSDFNQLLFKAMQGQVSDIERIFSRAFYKQEKSEELQEFFRNLKISSFED